MKKTGRKKLFSFLLALSLTANYLPYTTVLAEDTGTQNEETITLSLFERLNAATSVQEMDTIYGDATEAELKALTVDQLNTLITKVTAFEDDTEGFKSGLLANFDELLKALQQPEEETSPDTVTVEQTPVTTEDPQETEQTSEAPTPEGTQAPETPATAEPTTIPDAPEATATPTPTPSAEAPATPEATQSAEPTPSATPEAELSLYEKLMATKTAEEMSAIFDDLDDEPSFTSDELAALTEKVNGFPDDTDGIKAGLLSNLYYLATGDNPIMTLDDTSNTKTVTLETGTRSRSVWDLITKDFGVDSWDSASIRYKLYANGILIKELGLTNVRDTLDVEASVTYTLEKGEYKWIQTGKWKIDGHFEWVYEPIKSPIQYDITYPVTVFDNKDNQLATKDENPVFHVNGTGYSDKVVTAKEVDGKQYTLSDISATNVNTKNPAKVIFDLSSGEYTVTSSEYGPIKVTAEYTIQHANATIKKTDGIKSVNINGKDVSFTDSEAKGISLQTQNTMTVTCEYGYLLDSVTVNDSSIQADNDGIYSFTAEEGKTYEISVNAKANYYTVTGNVENATFKISLPEESKDGKVAVGDSYTVEVKPTDDDHVITEIKVGETPLTISYDEDGTATATDPSATSYKSGDAITVYVRICNKII